MTLEVYAAPILNGANYAGEHRTRFDISHTTGRLISADFSDFPTPPSSLTPSVAQSQAFATALGYIASRGDYTSHVELRPAELNVWKPVSLIPPGEDNFLTAQHAQMAANNQGLLVHDFFFECRDVAVKGGFYQPRWRVLVDAQSGSLLVAYKYMIFGGAPNRVANAPAVPTPDIGPGPLSVTNLKTKRRVQIPSTDLSACSAPKTRPAATDKLILQRGKYSLVAFYDSQSGLVWTERKGRRSYARADTVLRKALSQVR
jgi:hypothetical protein